MAAHQPEARFVVVGTSGSGKTTTAQRIAQTLDIPHIELDALHWDPDWTPAATPIFRQRVADRISADAWAVDGNYSRVRDLVWARATTVVWLDYPLWLVMWRVISRTFRRSFQGTELWNGNREDWRKGFMSQDSVIVWALTTYHRRRREYPQLFARPEHNHLHVIRHTSPRQTDEWITNLTSLYEID